MASNNLQGVTAVRGTSPSKHQAKQAYLNLVEAEKVLSPSLGLEIECVLAICTYPETSGNSCRGVSKNLAGPQIISDALRRPMRAVCCECGVTHTFWIPAKTVNENRSDNAYSEWEITTDASIELTAAELKPLGETVDFFEFYSVEIRSRILHADHPMRTRESQSAPGHIHTISWREEIRAVLAHLNKTFNTPLANGGPSRYRLLTNKSCGVHVHIGNRVNAGFPLKTVKNLLSTFTACEYMIDSLQASDRIAHCEIPTTSPDLGFISVRHGRTDEESAYNTSLCCLHAQQVYNRRSHELHASREMRENDPDWFAYPRSSFASSPLVKEAAYQFTTAAAVTIVQHAPDLAALKALQCRWEHQVTVNLENLPEAGENKELRKMTIEFRQHAATLNADELLAWVDVLLSITTHAHQTPDEEVAELCNGCSTQTIAHYESRVGASSLQHIVGQDDATKASPYHDMLLKNETDALNAVNALGPQDLFGPLVHKVLADRLATLHRGNINLIMLKKILGGGYGQLPDNLLDKIDFQTVGGDAAKQRLRVGYVSSAPAPGYNAWAATVSSVDCIRPSRPRDMELGGAPESSASNSPDRLTFAGLSIHDIDPGYDVGHLEEVSMQHAEDRAEVSWIENREEPQVNGMATPTPVSPRRSRLIGESW
ncbi:hypothetical protein LTR56_009512 [Elasticomyces elasticus]|nr:hypothetical protein LTR56_009512 [Elasticomyces elasticus]KAK3657191.1 hypothetical protein LTR22_009365 [Elasticomyces elasticus]KAK5760799.1 hypothetical protein LTS12_008975 [Elasticomyces elasticus]